MRAILAMFLLNVLSELNCPTVVGLVFQFGTKIGVLADVGDTVLCQLSKNFGRAHLLLQKEVVASRREQDSSAWPNHP